MLQNSQAAGHGGLKSSFINLSGPHLSNSPWHFNIFHNTSFFAPDMKLAGISPIFGKNNNLCLENYRVFDIPWWSHLRKIIISCLIRPLCTLITYFVHHRLLVEKAMYSCCWHGIKDRAHLSIFKFVIFEKFSCFIVLVVFLVVVQSSELISVWFCEKMTFKKKNY